VGLAFLTSSFSLEKRKLGFQKRNYLYYAIILKNEDISLDG
jgi:hypothetical protein